MCEWKLAYIAVLPECNHTIGLLERVSYYRNNNITWTAAAAAGARGRQAAGLCTLAMSTRVHRRRVGRHTYE